MWLILGADGQLGQCLQLVLSDKGIEFTAANRGNMDIANRDACISYISALKPQSVVNCAAWTAVDLAEDHEDNAYLINCDGARNVAVACHLAGATLIHISTDYVFSGISDTPYEVDSPTSPTSVYGRSKLCGELAIQEELSEKFYIFRTAWLYSQFRANFVKTMVRKAISNSPVRVVNDQIGQPTNASDLARHIVDVVTKNAPFGVYHGTNSGNASWYQLTQEIYSFLNSDVSLVSPVPTSEYPTKAVRPQYSVLSHSHTQASFIEEMPHWKISLHQSLPTITTHILEEESK